MLPRTSSPAHICLSCQLRLLSRSSVSFLSSTTNIEPRTYHAKKARNFQLRQFSSTRLNRLKISYESEPLTKYKQDDRHTPKSFIPANEPAGRLHGRNGQESREELRSLGVNMLGVPSDVIVLRDARKDWYHPPKLAPPVLPPQEDIDFLAAIEAERGLVPQSEVDANIEDHKPANPKVSLSEREFRRIRETMEEGFTIQQLQKYVRGYLVREAADGSRKEPVAQSCGGDKKLKTATLRTDVPTLLSKTSWFPDVTEENEPFHEHPLRGYSTIQHNTKQLLVLHVLRTCWKLDVREVLDSLGQLELRINQPEFELLIDSGPSPLEPIISRLRHEDSERIEAFRSQGILRITANRERALRISNDIEKNILDRIQRLDINLSCLMQLRTKKGPYEQALDISAMKEAAKMTGTSIIRNSRRMVSIHCINSLSDSKLASPAEVARRLLITYFTHFDKSTIRLGLQSPNSPHAEALIRCDDLNCLPWYYRLRTWVRRTSATRIGSDNDVEVQSETNVTWTNSKKEGNTHMSDRAATLANNLNQVLLPLFETVAVKPRNTKKPPIKFWSTKYFTASCIAIGQVLHEKANAMPIELVRDKESLTSSNYQAWSTTVLNLPSLMQRLKTGSESLPPQVSESVVMRFEPSPLSADGLKASKNSKAFPPVELRFGIDEVNGVTRNLILKDIIAVTQTNTSDVMIPHRPVDLRFHQRTTSRIPQGHLRQKQPVQITEFLRDSQLNLVAGIKTPARLLLPMDPHLCTDPRAWKKNAGTSNIMDVEYIFSGMDIKKKMTLDFNGWTLIYEDISSGKAGGKQRELRLRPTPTGSQPANEDEFIKAAFELVDVIGQGNARDISTPNLGEIQFQE